MSGVLVACAVLGRLLAPTAPLLLAPAAPLLAPTARRCAPATAITPDPFRPARPPLEPIVINAIQEVLSGTPHADAAAGALRARSADPDYALSEDEEALLRRWVAQCGVVSGALVACLAAAVEATPWVTKFGASASFGVGGETDPYVRACRAECMLALLILHVDGGEVSFIEEDRVEVLRDAPPPDAIEAVRVAVASAGTT